MQPASIAPGAIGGIAAVLAGAGAAPTGLPIVDEVWCGLLGVAVGLAAGRLRPATWLLLGAVLAPAAWGDLVAMLLVGVLFLAALVTTGSALPSLLVAGSVPGALLRLTWPTPPGSRAAFAGAVVVVVLVAGVFGIGRRGRRAAAGSFAVLGLVVVLLGISAVLALLAERSLVTDAVEEVEAGLVASREGDTISARQLLSHAAASLSTTRDRLDRPQVQLARAVPVLGRQLERVDALVSATADLARTGASATAAAEPDQLRPRRGRVDLGALDALAERLLDLRAALESATAAMARTASPWLLPPLVDAGDELDRRTEDARGDADGALQALTILPELLGAGGERRWLLIIQTPSELRGAGGRPGSCGVIRTDRGRVELEQLGRINDVGMPAVERGILASGSPEYLDRYRDVYGLDRFLQNSTASPHFPSVAQSMTARYQDLTDLDVDGAIAVDPYGLSALLGLVGPVETARWPEPVTAGNAPEVLLFEQYRLLVGDARVDLLEEIARSVFDRVIDGGLPGPADVGAALSPLLPQRRIQLWSSRPAEQQWFAGLGATGSLAPVQSDALGVVVNNASESKIDWFLHRQITYDVETARDGTTSAVVEVRLRNDAPASGLPAYIIGGPPSERVPAGWSRMLLSIFTPLQVGAATVDGVPADLFPPSMEQGRNVIETFVEVPPGESRMVRLELSGRLPTGPYRLHLHRQPVVHPDEVHVTVDGEILFDGMQDRDLLLDRRAAG